MSKANRPFPQNTTISERELAISESKSPKYRFWLDAIAWKFNSAQRKYSGSTVPILVQISHVTGFAAKPSEKPWNVSTYDLAWIRCNKRVWKQKPSTTPMVSRDIPDFFHRRYHDKRYLHQNWYSSPWALPLNAYRFWCRCIEPKSKYLTFSVHFP